MNVCCRKAVCWTILVTGMLSSLSVSALDPSRKMNQHTLETFTTEDGLPQSSVMSIIQTQDGYLWIGTFEGLARFDGIHFTVFDKTTVPELRNNTIKALYEDSQGILWIGTPNGLLSYDKGKFREFTINDGLAGNFVLSVVEDGQGHLWVGTTHGLSKWEGQKFRSYTTDDGLAHNYVSALAADHEGRLWVGTSQGLDRFDNGTFTHFTKESGLPHEDIRTLYVDSDGALWVGTSENGFATLRNDTFQTFSRAQGLNDLDVRVITRDREGIMWIGTNGGGIYCIQNNHLVHALSEKDGLLNTSVRSIAEDLEGSIWIGTRDGMYQLKDDKFIVLNSRNGLPVDSVRCVFQGRNGILWIGTVGGGLVKFDGDDFHAYTTRDGLPSNYIWSITDDTKGNLWIGTYGGGLVRMKDETFKTYSTRNGLSNNIVRAVFVDNRNQVWAGTNGGGVNVLTPEGIQHFTTKDGLSDNFVYSITQDNGGDMWVGTYSGGLNQFHDGKITVYAKKDGFTNNGTWVIHPDTDGSLWIGTGDDGLFHYINGRFNRFTIRDGLYSDSTFSITEDRQHNLWMNCNRGIFSVNKQDLLAVEAGKKDRVSCVSLGKREGIKVTESNGPAQPAACQTSDGALWFSTIKGIAIIHPDNMRKNRIPPPVAIESASVNGENFSPFNPIQAPRGKGNMEIQYTGLSYLLPDKVQFKYRLEGYDTEWQLAGSRRTAFYTNLPAKAYTFRVIACNNDGIWNEKGKSLSIRLKPAWTETWWFYTIVGIMLLIIVLILYLLRIGQLRRQEKWLQSQIRDRTRQLKALNLKLQHLARTDALTDIPNHRYLMNQLEREWKTAFRDSKALSLVFIDIDRFKMFNDKFGHQEGDKCLRRVAQKLLSELKRPRDFIARYGGEEFVVILPDTDREGALLIAERLRAAIENSCGKEQHLKVPTRITISLGVSTIVPVDQKEFNLLIRAADKALYIAKDRGRNRVEFLEP